MEQQHPLPLLTEENARQKIQMAEIQAFLKEKRNTKRDHKLKQSHWAHGGNRIAVRFGYAYRNPAGEWFHAHGNKTERLTQTASWTSATLALQTDQLPKNNEHSNNDPHETHRH